MSTPVTIAVGDPHGCWYTLVRLLNTCAAQHPGARLVLLGDLIDRGPHSRKVVEFAMENKVAVTMANHESLALAFYEKDGYDPRCGAYYDRGVWLNNGGDIAVRGWNTIDKRILTGPQIAQAEFLGGRVPDKVLRWFESLPPYVVVDTVDEQGRRLLASHTGFGLDADKDTSDGWFKALWGRYPDDDDFPVDGYYRVYGHTRLREPLWTPTSCGIDTGAAYKGYGTLTAFVWPSKTLVQQPYDETPVKPLFEVVDGCIC